MASFNDIITIPGLSDISYSYLPSETLANMRAVNRNAKIAGLRYDMSDEGNKRKTNLDIHNKMIESCKEFKKKYLIDLKPINRKSLHCLNKALEITVLSLSRLPPAIIVIPAALTLLNIVLHPSLLRLTAVTLVAVGFFALHYNAHYRRRPLPSPSRESLIELARTCDTELRELQELRRND